jgi:hypothetical protein
VETEMKIDGKHPNIYLNVEIQRGWEKRSSKLQIIQNSPFCLFPFQRWSLFVRHSSTCLLSGGSFYVWSLKTLGERKIFRNCNVFVFTKSICSTWWTLIDNSFLGNPLTATFIFDPKYDVVFIKPTPFLKD